MRLAAFAATAATLPPTLRGQDGFVRLVQGVGLRLSVIGTRGKSTLATMVAAALARRGLGVHCNAPAPPAEAAPSGLLGTAMAFAGLEREDRALFAQAADGIQLSWPVAALVLRNPATASSSLRAFHERIALPHYVLLTNVRHDPHGPLPPTLEAAARAAVRSVTPGAVLVSGESDALVKAVLRRECERAGVPFVDAAPARAEVPGLELIAILDTLLRHRFGAGLQAPEVESMRRDLEARFRWMPSTIPGVSFFDAGPIHDVDSTQIVLNHLQAQRRHPVTFVASFRRDRPGRTRSYIQFLADLLNAPDTRQVFLSGPGARSVAAGLRAWESQVHVVPDDVASVPRLVRRLQFECLGGAVVLLANGGPEWPRALSAALQKATPPAVARPPRPEAQPSAAPKHITRPLVAPAPSIPDLGEAFSLARFTRPSRPAPLPRAAPAGPAATATALAQAVVRSPPGKTEAMPAGRP